MWSWWQSFGMYLARGKSDWARGGGFLYFLKMRDIARLVREDARFGCWSRVEFAEVRESGLQGSKRAFCRFNSISWVFDSVRWALLYFVVQLL